MTCTALPLTYHASDGETPPGPFVEVSSQKLVCHCHVSRELVFIVKETFVVPPEPGTLPLPDQLVQKAWVVPPPNVIVAFVTLQVSTVPLAYIHVPVPGLEAP